MSWDFGNARFPGLPSALFSSMGLEGLPAGILLPYCIFLDRFRE
jgi:hypothetical protein